MRRCVLSASIWILSTAAAATTALLASCDPEGTGEPPATPRGLSVSARGSSSLVLLWDAAAGASTYQAFRDTSANGPYSVQVYDDRGTGFVDTGLELSTAYYYRVRATNAAGSSALSSSVSWATLPETLDACDSLGGWTSRNVLSLDSHEKREGSASIASAGDAAEEFWKVFEPFDSGLSPGEAHLQFWYYVSDATALAADNQVELGSGGAMDTREYNWSLQALGNGWNFVSLKITDAQTTGGPADLQAINWFRIYYHKNVSVTTRIDDLRLVSGVDGGMAPLASPSLLAANAISTSAVDLSWQDNSADEEGFEIERDRGGQPGTTGTIRVAAGQQAYSDVGLSDGSEYRYRIRSFKGPALSVWAGEAVAVTPLGAPTDLEAEVVSETQVDLSWRDTSTSEIGMELERSKGSTTEYVRLAADRTSHSDTGLVPGSDYSYRVRAVKDTATSAWSNQTQARTATGASVTITLVAPEDYTIDLGEFDGTLQRPSEVVYVTAWVAGTPDSYRWYLNGQPIAGADGPTRRLAAWQLALGGHLLSVVVTKDAVPYSASLRFQVLESP